MDVINKRGSTLFMFFVLTVCGKCFAQSKPSAFGNHRPRFYFDKPITLDSLTRYVHSHSRIRFSFNSSKVKGNKVIYLKKGVYTTEYLLQQIRKNTSLYYSMYNGYVIFQDNPPKQRTTPKNNTKPPVQRQAIAAHRKPVSKRNNKPDTQQPATEIKPQAAAIVLPAETDTTAIPASPDTGKQWVTVADTAVVNKHLTIQSQAPLTVLTPGGTTKDEHTDFVTQPGNSSYNGKKTDLRWQFGLQWKAALPLYGSQYYFTGTNTRSEPYNLLIPGIWLSVLSNVKHEVMLMVKPAEWYFYNKKAFHSDSGFLYRNHDTIPVTTSTRLIKTSGLYGSLQYNYHINEKWIVGAGIGYHLRGRSLLNQQIYRLFSGIQALDTLYSLKNDTTTNRYLASSFVSGKVEIAYRVGALDMGATLLLPLTAPFTEKSRNKSRPLNLQIFLRWRIKRNNEE
jgi:hypothetical protein